MSRLPSRPHSAASHRHHCFRARLYLEPLEARNLLTNLSVVPGSQWPPHNGTGVGVSDFVRVKFTQDINESTLTGNFLLDRWNGSWVPVNNVRTAYISPDRSPPVDPRSCTVSPTGGTCFAFLEVTRSYPIPYGDSLPQPLEYNTTYRVRLEGGIRQYGTGKPLQDPQSWTFTTARNPATGTKDYSTADVPILVITSNNLPFTSYYAEILRAEGLNEFATCSLDVGPVGDVLCPRDGNNNLTDLARFDVVLLGDIGASLTTTPVVSSLSTYVQNGGNLIVMRPADNAGLRNLLGLNPPSGTYTDKYLKVRTAQPPGAGIVPDTIQFHGTADLYTFDAGAVVADLCPNNTPVCAANPYSAVTLRQNIGGGGKAAAFTYDLARSVVLTRQGNPTCAGQHFGEYPNLTFPTNWFCNNWLDASKVAIPQADEQQRLLANLIGHMNLAKKPLPRFWYLPNGAKAVVLMTSDDHASYEYSESTADRFDSYVDGISGGFPIRSSAYISGQSISPALAAYYTARGFEVGVHVFMNEGDSCQDWPTPTQLREWYAEQLRDFSLPGWHYPGIPFPSTHRTHCTPWSDFDTQPQVEFENRLRLDTNYRYWPRDWLSNPNPDGLFTGSGLPMRFATQGGRIIDTYQAATQMTDDIEVPPGRDPVAWIIPRIDALLNAALDSRGYYGVFTILAHSDCNELSYPISCPAVYPFHGEALSNAVVNRAIANNVAVRSGREMLEWLDGRNGSSFSSFSWNPSNTLRFTLTKAVGANGLMVMLPRDAQVAGQTVTLSTVRRNGGLIALLPAQQIKGVWYYFVDGQGGSYELCYGPNCSASPGPGGGGAHFGNEALALPEIRAAGFDTHTGSAGAFPVPFLRDGLAASAPGIPPTEEPSPARLTGLLAPPELSSRSQEPGSPDLRSVALFDALFADIGITWEGQKPVFLEKTGLIPESWSG